MNIKCYYPKEPYKDQHRWCANVIFEKLTKKLVTTYPSIKFELIDSIGYSEKLGIHHHSNPGQKFGYHRMILENSINKKYFVVNYYDSLQSIHSINNWDTENLIEVFSSTGVHKDHIFYNNSNIDYTPSSYCLRQVTDEDYLLKNKTNTSTNIDLTFRGELYLFRKFLKNDSRFKIINSYYNKLSEKDYLKELQDNFISLSLNGIGEICHRDIESFGAFSTVIRPELTVQFHNKLIPDYHYISIPTDDIKSLNTISYYTELSNRLYSKYLEVKNDKEYLRYIALNARKWFIENGTINKNVEILIKLIDFQKLM